MGRPGNLDPRCFWQADLDEAAGRLVWLIRRYQPDVITTYNDFGGYGHPDHIRTHDVAVRAFPRAGDPAWYPEQLAPGARRHGPGRRRRRARAVDAVQALRAGHPGLRPRRRCATGSRSSASRASGRRPRTRRRSSSPSSRPTWRRCSSPTRRSRPGSTSPATRSSASGAAIHEHVTQISDDSPFMLFGLDGWREVWAKEAYILRESTRRDASARRSDLFAGLVLTGRADAPHQGSRPFDAS